MTNLLHFCHNQYGLDSCTYVTVSRNRDHQAGRHRATRWNSRTELTDERTVVAERRGSRAIWECCCSQLSPIVGRRSAGNAS